MYQSKGITKGLLAFGMAGLICFASCDSKKNTDTKTDAKPETKVENSGTNSGKIAYVDMDTLQAKYEFLKTQKATLEKRSADLEAELGRMAKSIQSVYTDLAKKDQAKSLSPVEREAGQKKLQEMQQNLEERKQSMGAQLMKDNEAFTKEIQARLDKYLLKYNATKHYDYILSYQKGGSILFANHDLDITSDVVKGMNEDDKANGGK